MRPNELRICDWHLKMQTWQIRRGDSMNKSMFSDTTRQSTSRSRNPVIMGSHVLAPAYLPGLQYSCRGGIHS